MAPLDLGNNNYSRPNGGVINIPENGPLSLPNCAVQIKNLCKRYSEKGPAVLQNYGMTVRKGTIYGLLGSSGCGKTTILSCIVGLQKWDSGDLLVFGKKPGTPGSGIPGKRLGYMPQDLALYDQLTIREVCRFYGHIYNMSGEEMRERWKFLQQLLELTADMKQIGNLSGGQKRRASLALALIHSPDLLILDEPTVGLDPLLREKIWMHLHALVKTLGTTVIITTHYIEEARLSATIGVMRKGRLLVEDAPQNLLKSYNCDLLEQVVLQLCRKDATDLKTVTCTSNVNPTSAFNSGWNNDKVVSSSVTVTNEEFVKMTGKFQQMKKFDNDISRRLSVPKYNSNNPPKTRSVGDILSKIRMTPVYQTLNRIYGYSVVLFLILCRHLGLLSVILIMPTIQGSLTIVTLGSEPTGMGFGIVNNEAQNWTSECQLPRHSGNSCDLSFLSCKYLNLVGKDGQLILTPAQDEEEALRQVHRGDTWGYLVFPSNYSQHGLDRAVAGRFAMNSTLEGFQIKARLDHSQFIGSAYVTSYLLNSFKGYVEQVVRSCNIGGNMAELPIHFRTPIHGLGLTAFIVPGVIICSFLGITMGLTAIILISDRKQGTLSRAQAAGLQFVDVVMGYLITQGAVSIAQIVIWQLVLYFVFGFVILGPLWLWLAFLLLSGICGAALGIFLGIISKDEVEALVIGVFLIPVFLLFGGTVFPTEAMSRFWIIFGRLLPTHLPTMSLRSVVVRGLGLTHALVWPGFAALVVWILIFLILGRVAFSKICK